MDDCTGVETAPSMSRYNKPFESDQFETLYGTRHPDTLAILYNFAFNLIRDKFFEEAEELLRQLSQDSRLTLGPSHLQTITAQ